MADISELENLYRESIMGKLKEEFSYENVMQIPKIKKVVVNSCLSEAVQNSKILDTVANEMGSFTGQKPVIVKAKRSEANFKLRKGQPLAVKVTLRGKSMWNFLNKLIKVALPRVRDFKGVSGKAFDGKGNYTLGVKDQIIFPEIDYDKVSKVYGMNISIVTSAKTDPEAKSLLKALGMPFNN